MSGFFWPPRGQGAAPRARLGGNGGSGGSVPVSMRGHPGMRSLRSFLPQNHAAEEKLPEWESPKTLHGRGELLPACPSWAQRPPKSPPALPWHPSLGAAPLKPPRWGCAPPAAPPALPQPPLCPPSPPAPGAAGKLGSGQNETSFPLPSWVTISAPRELGGHQPAPESTAPRGAAAPASRRSQHKHLCCL